MTVVYAADATGGTKNPAPELTRGDEETKKAFRPLYLKYIETHDNNQYSQPTDHLTLPKVVVECVDTDLL